MRNILSVFSQRYKKLNVLCVLQLSVLLNIVFFFYSVPSKNLYYIVIVTLLFHLSYSILAYILSLS